MINDRKDGINQAEPPSTHQHNMNSKKNKTNKFEKKKRYIKVKTISDELEKCLQF